MSEKSFDKIIIGAGLYGLYAALISARKGEKVLVLEADPDSLSRATYVNQARVHLGYHYPRSLSTAIKAAGYFRRFVEQFPECIYSDFKQIYATASHFSWTDAAQFKSFSDRAGVGCIPVPEELYFKAGMVDGAFLTDEVTFDAGILRDSILRSLAPFTNAEILYSSPVTAIKKSGDSYEITAAGNVYSAPFVLNSTYASVNQICAMAGFEPFKIKYELCEVILCNVSDALKNVGLTVMDGPFFSVMPFGRTGLHSLTGVTFTPHETCFDPLPAFKCQEKSGGLCSPSRLGNCNSCPCAPDTAWDYMNQLARQYMRDEFRLEYVKSLYSMKPILLASDVDDSRPTCIKIHSEDPTFVSVLSGKISTVYDLESVL
ncbi:MAG: FAD-binding oxidoreductase [Parasporobacterium sp.]|nr:FAD-binding oxidoreductase [Parasporobacterium sp.]